MMAYGAVVIDTNYDDDLLPRNRVLACFIVEKTSKKIVNSSFVERRVLGDWYCDKVAHFPVEHFKYLISAISIVGEILSIVIHEPSAANTSKNDGDRFKPN